METLNFVVFGVLILIFLQCYKDYVVMTLTSIFFQEPNILHFFYRNIFYSLKKNCFGSIQGIIILILFFITLFMNFL